MSRHGASWIANFLEKKWDSIMNEVAKKPRSELEIAALSAIRGVLPTRRREA
jgi:hypothetical protein